MNKICEGKVYRAILFPVLILRLLWKGWWWLQSKSAHKLSAHRFLLRVFTDSGKKIYKGFIFIFIGVHEEKTIRYFFLSSYKSLGEVLIGVGVAESSTIDSLSN